MPLVSQQFKNDDELEQCLVDDVHHVVPGVRGPHVAKIQEALIKLGEGVISAAGLSTMQYGNTTAQSVLAYKTRRGIINKAYQTELSQIF